MAKASRSKLVSYGGRFALLEAIAEINPRVLQDLFARIFPIYERLCQSGGAIKNWEQLDLLPDSKEVCELRASIQKWANPFDGPDRWFCDAAVQTMHFYLAAGSTPGPAETSWHYTTAPMLRFEPPFGVWIPPYSSWREFQEACDEVYRKELTKYRKRIEQIWGWSKPSLKQHAAWTVLWQMGKSPAQIKRWHLKHYRQRVSESAVQNAVRRFANEIGLTLRAPRGGRNRSKSRT